MTQDSFGILFDSDIEGENLLNVIKSNNFIDKSDKEVIKH